MRPDPPRRQRKAHGTILSLEGESTKVFRIFESMNDRGTRLTPVDLLKSFLLSHVGEGEEDLNLRWRRMLSELTISRDDEGAPTRFLKAAL